MDIAAAVFHSFIHGASLSRDLLSSNNRCLWNTLIKSRLSVLEVENIWGNFNLRLCLNAEDGLLNGWIGWMDAGHNWMEGGREVYVAFFGLGNKKTSRDGLAMRKPDSLSNSTAAAAISQRSTLLAPSTALMRGKPVSSQRHLRATTSRHYSRSDGKCQRSGYVVLPSTTLDVLGPGEFFREAGPDWKP